MASAEWRPAAHNGVCVFTAAVGEASYLLTSIEHNANWAVAHRCSFTLFTAKLAGPRLHPQWEKVFATERMLQRAVPTSRELRMLHGVLRQMEKS